MLSLLLHLKTHVTQSNETNVRKIGFFILGEERKAEIKKQQNKNATKSPFQCLFSAIILSLNYYVIRHVTIK